MSHYDKGRYSVFSSNKDIIKQAVLDECIKDDKPPKIDMIVSYDFDINVKSDFKQKDYNNPFFSE